MDEIEAGRLERRKISCDGEGVFTPPGVKGRTSISGQRERNVGHVTSEGSGPLF